MKPPSATDIIGASRPPQAPTRALTEAPTAGGPASGRVALVLAVYVLSFWVALPGLLWMLGERLDGLLGLAQQSALWGRLGLAIGALGIAWLTWSMLTLGRHGAGWPVSHLPPRGLVSAGPYTAMRHPIYVGYTAAFAGVGLASGSLGRGVLATTLLAVGWIVYALGFEEPRLARRHGEAYLAFRAGTPLIPLPFQTVLRTGLRAIWTRLRPTVERLANRTVLFRLGPTVWVTYGALVASGAAVMAAGVGGLLTADGVSSATWATYVVGLAVAMLLGGRIVWLLYFPHLLWKDFRRTFRTVGFVSWGGLLGLFSFSLAFAAAAGLDALRLLDRTVLPSLACVAFGRLGCLTYGCCYGLPSAHGIRWTNPEAKVIRERGHEAAVPRVPTQLLAAVNAFLGLGVLGALTYTAAPSGTVTAVGLLLYGADRFAIDCLRDERRFFGWSLTAGQIGGAVAIAGSLGLLFLIDGPPGWETPLLSLELGTMLATWPIVLGVALPIFLVCAFHWRRVGQW